MRVIAYTHLGNVYTDVEHSDVDVQFNIEVLGAKGEDPERITVTSYTSFSSCYGTAIKIASYYDVKNKYGTNLVQTGLLALLFIFISIK